MTSADFLKRKDRNDRKVYRKEPSSKKPIAAEIGKFDLTSFVFNSR